MLSPISGDVMRHDATERSRLFAAFAEGSVDGALRHAGASPATWSPVRALLRERNERADVAERQAAQEHLQQTLAAVSSGLASIHLGTSLD